MAKYFLGSVGKAEAFRRNEGKMQIAFVSKTLTDSGLNISTTKDDIRGGQGAPIQFSFYHDPNVEINLTDIVWKKEYLEVQLGASFDQKGESYETEKVACSTDDSLTLEEQPIDMPFICEDVGKNVVWYSEIGTDDWYIGTFVGKVVSAEGVKKGKNYCVRYLKDNNNAKVAKIYSQIIPEELFLIITAPIFAGDACAASKGKAAGHITFEVPRFQLNGAQEFSMNMSSNQNMSLAGIALASEDLTNCDSGNGGQLLRVIQVISNENWYDDAVDLISDDDAYVGDVPEFAILRKDGSIAPAPNSGLTFPTGSVEAATLNYKWKATGSYDVCITGKTTLVETVTVKLRP